MHRFTVTRDFGRLTAEVVVSDDGTFTIGGAGPYHIEAAPISRSDYGHNEVWVKDARGWTVITGYENQGLYTFEQATDKDKWKAAARGMWELGG